MRSSGPVIRTSSPVSSPTSRRAVSSVVSSGCGVPLGRVHVRPSRSRRRLPTTSWGRPASYRTTMPPAEVAVAVLRRATAPGRRWDDDPHPIVRSGPSASPQPAGHDALGRTASPVAARDGSRASARTVRRRRRAARSGRPWWRRTSPALRGRVGALALDSTGARNAPPAAPRTWRRCYVPWAAMVLGRSCLASARPSVARMVSAVSGASARRSSARSISRCAAAT